jgi:hypothetical protein
MSMATATRKRLTSASITLYHPMLNNQKNHYHYHLAISTDSEIQSEHLPACRKSKIDLYN